MAEPYAPTIPTYGTQNRPKYNGPVRPGLGTGVSNTKPLAATMQQAEGQPKQPGMEEIMERAIRYYAINPEAGPDPRFTTGNRALDMEAQRLGRIRNFQLSGTGKSAVEAAKAQQWMTGQRSLADEMPGEAVPSYAAKPEVGPPQNGVWQAPDGNRYLMVDGVVSGVAGAGVAPTGGETRAERLGGMREMFDKAISMDTSKKTAPAAPQPTMGVAAPTTPTPMPVQQGGAPLTPPTATTPQPTEKDFKAGESKLVKEIANDPARGGIEAAFDYVARTGKLGEEELALAGAEIAGGVAQIQRDFEKATQDVAKANAEAQEALGALQTGVSNGPSVGFTSAFGGIPSNVGKPMSNEQRGELAKKVEQLRADAAEAEEKRVELVKKMAEERSRVLRKYLEKALSK